MFSNFAILKSSLTALMKPIGLSFIFIFTIGLLEKASLSLLFSSDVLPLENIKTSFIVVEQESVIFMFLMVAYTLE
jgi:hypothetical protein